MVTSKKTNKKTISKATASTTKTKSLQSKTVEVKTPTQKKSLWNFLFSFNGNISKELFLGSTFILLLTSLLCETIFSLITLKLGYNPYIDWTYNIIALVLLVIAISLGYKRAHSLGISGFYSIVGTLLFKPYFCFFNPEKDTANDSAYAPKFERVKRIGTFFGKSSTTQILYITLLGILSLIPYSYAGGTPEAAETIRKISLIIIAIAGFNILQVLILNSKGLKKVYTPLVKVFSFIGYNFLIIGITVLIYSTYILLAMMQTMQVMPK